MRAAPYGLVAALLLVRFADEWAAFLPAGALEPIRHDLGLSYAEAGLVLVALPAGGLLGNVFVVAADYVSRRLLASLGALAYGLGLIAFALSHDLPTLLAAAFVWGAASDAFIHGCEVALVDVAGEDLPRALARMNGWASVGDFAGPITLAACALLGFGWRGAFLGLGAAMLGYGAWIACLRLPPPHPREGRARPLANLWAIARDRRVILLAVVLGLFGLLDEPMDGFIIAYLERVRGLGPALASLPVLAILAGFLAGFAGHERLTAGRTPRQVVVGASALMTAALAVVLFAPVLTLESMAGFVFGVAGAVLYTTLEAEVLRARPGQAGATSAVVSTIGMAGIGFPVLVGMAADAHGLAAGVALYAAIPVLILALVWLDRPGAPPP